MTKFKVGDRVRWNLSSVSWQDVILTEVRSEGAYPYSGKDTILGQGAFKEEWLELIGTPNNNGGSTDYYRLPEGATELNDLIEARNMSFALGNIFKACYRFGEKDSASKVYDLNKIIYFAERLKAIEERDNSNP